jgi:hypothetical protein|tara:strand:+ start:3256 stop:3477 length:222 start_codon:yes stop_codon:yes gene_type:complete
MKFVQSLKDGSCDIVFEEHEIKIINDNKKLHLSPETLKHFGNVMAKIIMEWNFNFNDEIKAMQTRENTEIKGK